MRRGLRIVLKILLVILGLGLLLIVAARLFVHFNPVFGGSAEGERLDRMEASPNYRDGQFHNLAPVSYAPKTPAGKSAVGDKLELMMDFLFPPAGKNPDSPIETVPLRADSLQDGQFAWLGHSTVLFRIGGITVATDPVFYNAAPVSFLVKPFAMTHRPRVEDMPFVDVVIISHDHYDHLDMRAIRELQDSVGCFIVPLGVGAHLERWGVPPGKIRELDWYETERMGEVDFTLAPSRHFSGRGPTDRMKTLWGSWAMVSPQLRVYFSGDGGYSPEFAKIGERFGGFDLAFLENGAYNIRWPDIHMQPEQTAQAAIDLHTKRVLPIHWSKFDLSTHQWQEPPRRLGAALQKHNDTVEDGQKVAVLRPMIGEVFGVE
ncbi:MAG: hypothetical protein CSA97_00290 [Bacteroidetes bacterium]|nr:MAG: hypothetical protein CSA97_00290 [Bacteroidota bacterium]